MDEAAGAGAAAGRDERLGLAQVVTDAAEGRRGTGRVRRRIGQLGQRGEGRADAVGDAAHVQRNGHLAEQQEEQSVVQWSCSHVKCTVPEVLLALDSSEMRSPWRTTSSILVISEATSFWSYLTHSVKYFSF